jgi:ParB family transcriptional regulator, chromosome partitioning protein
VGTREGAPFPADDLAYHVEQHYLTRLERAPFSLKDAKLVPQAGSCTSCPKRGGKQPLLFSEEIPKDTCTDRTCFHAKLEAHREKLGADVIAQGGSVLTEQQSREIFRGSYQLPWNSKYVDVDARCAEDPSGHTGANSSATSARSSPLASDPGSTPHALALRSEALSALEQAGVELVPLLHQAAAGTRRAVRRSGGGESEPDSTATASEDVPTARTATRLRNTTIANILGAITAAAEARPAGDATFARLVFESMAGGGLFRPADYAAHVDKAACATGPRVLGVSVGGTLTRHKLPRASRADFWLAGQGAYEIQTALALARISAALALGEPLPAEIAAEGGGRRRPLAGAPRTLSTASSSRKSHTQRKAFTSRFRGAGFRGAGQCTYPSGPSPSL